MKKSTWEREFDQLFKGFANTADEFFEKLGAKLDEAMDEASKNLANRPSLMERIEEKMAEQVRMQERHVTTFHKTQSQRRQKIGAAPNVSADQKITMGSIREEGLSNNMEEGLNISFGFDK